MTEIRYLTACFAQFPRNHSVPGPTLEKWTKITEIQILFEYGNCKRKSLCQYITFNNGTSKPPLSRSHVICCLSFHTGSARRKEEVMSFHFFPSLIEERRFINKCLHLQTVIHHSRQWRTYLALNGAQIHCLVKNWKDSFSVITSDCLARPTNDYLQLSCVILMFQVPFNNSNEAKLHIHKDWPC